MGGRKGKRVHAHAKDVTMLDVEIASMVMTECTKQRERERGARAQNANSGAEVQIRLVEWRRRGTSTCGGGEK